MNWGFHIKRLREERHLTQGELAAKAGLTRSHVSQIERGAYLSVKEMTLKRLAKGLNMTLESLAATVYEIKTPTLETPEEVLQRFSIILPESVPIYEEFPFHAGEAVEPVDYTPVVRDRSRKRNLEGYIVRGSCLTPTIEDKDIIIIDRDNRLLGERHNAPGQTEKDCK
jgi:transcriptional regulator with XRE-family HTH domain